MNYDLKYRMAIRVASDLTDALRYHGHVTADSAQALFDRLVDVLVAEPDDFLLSFVPAYSAGPDTTFGGSDDT